MSDSTGEAEAWAGAGVSIHQKVWYFMYVCIYVGPSVITSI